MSTDKGTRDEARETPPLVVHIIYSLGTGGLENGLVNIINRMPPERYRHAIVCLTQATDFAHRIHAPDVAVFELHKRPGNDFAVYWRLWRLLRRLRPAIVHTRNIAALESQVLGVIMPSVRRIHGEHGRDIYDLDGSNPRYRWLRRGLSPLIDRFIAVSGDLEHWLQQDVGIRDAKVVQIYNGVDHTRFASSVAVPVDLPAAYTPAEGRVIIGTVGRLADVKDQQSLIRALARTFEHAPTERNRLRCIVVGDGPQRETLAKLTRDLGLDESVFFAGDSNDVPAWLSAMDVFLLPSLGEGISNTVLEAMASGLPVVATAVGGNPELVDDGVTGLLVPVADIESLARAIQRLVTDAELRETMGTAGQKKVRERFDWTRTVSSYLSVYDDVLDPR